MAEIATLGIRIDSRQAVSQMRKLGGGFDRLKSKARTTVGGIRESFAAIPGAIFNVRNALAALGVGFVFRDLIEEARDFEAALVGVGKTTNITGSELEALGNDFVNLSRNIPVATSELLEIGQTAGQLGVTGSDNILKFSDTIAKLGRASNLAGEEGATALARILNVTNENIGTVDKLASVIVQLGNNFAATEKEIARATTEVAKATAQFGVSSDQAAAFGTALASIGVRAESGGSVIGRAFRAINDAVLSGGDELDKLSRIMGTTGEEIQRVFEQDSPQAFSMFLQGLNRIRAQGGNVSAVLAGIGLSGDEINKILPTLAGNFQNLARAQRLAANEAKNATALEKEFAAQAETLDSQLILLNNEFTATKLAIAQEIAPSFKIFAGGLREILVGSRDLISQGIKVMIAEFQLWADVTQSVVQDVSDFFSQGFGGITASASATADFLGQAFLDFPANVKAAVQIALLEWEKFVTRLFVVFDSVRADLAKVLLLIRNGFEVRFKSINLVIKEQIADAISFVTDSLDSLGATLTRLGITDANPFQGVTDGLKGIAPDVDAAKAEIQALNDALDDTIRQLQLQQVAAANAGAGQLEAIDKQIMAVLRQREELLKNRDAVITSTRTVIEKQDQQTKAVVETTAAMKQLRLTQEDVLSFDGGSGAASETLPMLAETTREWAEQMQRTLDPTIAINEELQKLADLEAFQKASGEVILTQEQLKKLREELNETKSDAILAMQEFGDVGKQVADDLEQAFEDGFFDIMQGNFDDLGTSFKKTIDRMVADLLASQLRKTLEDTFKIGGGSASSGGTGFGGFFTSILGGLFGGFRQTGGQVNANRSFLVGEGGPEMFIPPTRGRVEPLGQNVSVNMTINTSASEFSKESASQLATQAGLGVRRAIARNT